MDGSKKKFKGQSKSSYAWGKFLGEVFITVVVICAVTVMVAGTVKLLVLLAGGGW